MRGFASEPPRSEFRVVRMRTWPMVRGCSHFPVSAAAGRCRTDEIRPGRPRVSASHDGEAAAEFELE